MAVTVQNLTDVASEFSAVDADRFARLVTLATLQVPASKWGDLQELGITYLVAHMLKLDANRNGAVTQERIGDLSRSFATAAGGKGDPLEQTAYGVEFKRLRSTLVAGPMVI